MRLRLIPSRWARAFAVAGLLGGIVAGCAAAAHPVASGTQAAGPGATTPATAALVTPSTAQTTSTASPTPSPSIPLTPATDQPSPADGIGAEPGAASRSASPIPGAEIGSSFVLQIPILMYHRIISLALAGDSLPDLVVPPALFDAQLSALHTAGWHTVTVAQISQAIQLHRTLPPRTFAISIDDGWDDGYTYALPILQRYGFHATYYVIAGRVGTWENVLTPPELRTLVADGMEVGDHTLNHRALPYLSPAEMHIQVMTAADLLAGFVGKRPVTFAYPAGRYDPAAEAELQADGFGMAVIEGSGAWESAADRFAVPRVRVSPTTTPAFLLGELRALEPGA
ncbi:MAG: polysaccharide deacetylase family protein [Candidatus Limnocylindrales bacterium]